MIRILIADDHAIVRAGLKQFIADQADMEVAAEASSGSEAIAAVRARDFDVVLLDISMPDKNGIDTLKTLKHVKPELPVLMLSALLLAELEEEAGLPPGWLNVVVGPASEIGDALVEDDRIKAITFTGSGTVGWKLKERAPRKRVNLELGNATPVIVCSDAPPSTVDKIAANAFSFAGQSCISIQRVYVLNEAWDDFLRDLVPKVEALRVGDPADEETDVGPVIDDDARERILDWIGKTSGEVVTGGDTTEGGLIRPTVIANPDASDKLSCEEVFGPVVTVTRTSSLDEAIELANSTRYGLQAGIFTGDLQSALVAAQRLEFGGVTINEAPTFRADQMPYGGVKESGNTREGPHYAVRELTEERLVVLQLP